MPSLLHVVRPTEWDEMAGVEALFGADVDRDGFVHCCLAAQLDGVIERYYADAEELVVVEIDPERLGPAVVRFEGATEAFPHVYGTVPRAAVVGSRRVRARRPG